LDDRLLLIALAVLWLALVAFVATMCRLAAHSDKARTPGSVVRARTSHSHPRKAAAPRQKAAHGRPLRSSMRVE
jgi:hypothetical protein